MFSNIFWSFANFLIKRFGHTNDPRQFSIEILRTFLAKFVTVWIAVLGAFLGAVTILVDLILSSYRQQQLLVSDVTAVGAFLIAASITAFIIVFRKQSWEVSVDARPRRPSLSHAFASLIYELAETKKYERERRLLNTSHQPGGLA